MTSVKYGTGVCNPGSWKVKKETMEKTRDVRKTPLMGDRRAGTHSAQTCIQACSEAARRVSSSMASVRAIYATKTGMKVNYRQQTKRYKGKAPHSPRNSKTDTPNTETKGKSDRTSNCQH